MESFQKCLGSQMGSLCHCVPLRAQNNGSRSCLRGKVGILSADAFWKCYLLCEAVLGSWGVGQAVGGGGGGGEVL